MRILKTLLKRNLIGATWFEDPTKYEYIRMSEIIINSKSKKSCAPFRHKTFKVIGYTKPQKLQKVGIYGFQFKKNVFWLKEYDRGMPKEKNCYGKEDYKKNKITPCEAVKIV